VTNEQFSLLVNVSTSALLAVLFLALVATSVVLYLTWYGLRAARRDLPGFLADVDEALGHLEAAAHDTTAAALRGPIRAISAWQGLKTGFRVLFARSSPARTPPGDRPTPV